MQIYSNIFWDSDRNEIKQSTDKITRDTGEEW